MKKISETKDDQKTIYVYADRLIHYEFIKAPVVKLSFWHSHPWYREIERKKCSEQPLRHAMDIQTFKKLLSSYETMAQHDIDLFVAEYNIYINMTAQQAKEILKNKDEIIKLFEQFSI